MDTTKKRTLTITCGEGENVERKHHTCFISNLIADASKEKPLIRWYRSNAKDGIIYCSNGLAEGTLMTLRMLTEKPGVEFTYNRHGKRIYTAVETDGDINCPMHLAHLLHKVTCTVTMAEAAQKKTPAELLSDLKPKAPEPEEYCIKVIDVFRSIDVDELVAMVLDNPTMLSLGVAKTSPDRARIEALIRSTVTFIQNVKPRETAVLMQSFGLKSLADGSHCGHLVTSPLPKVANAYVQFNERYYGGMTPNQRNLKFAMDIIVNLLAGV